MEIILITTAFVAGYLALKCTLPPLVGFLLAGFGLHAFGYQSNDVIVSLADLGVTLLLFTIGLKLDVKTLLSKEIWGGATAHNILSTAVFTIALTGLKLLGLTSLAGMDIGQVVLLAFALSFSSTVFAVKTLQEKGEMSATYGTVAIGILVMQDIFAVVFLTASTGKIPEWYAIALFGLPLLRPLFYKLLDKVGHGEMLVLFGIFFALVVGAGLFELVGMKADLGALILGMLLAGHRKASELSKSLFNMKELFLVCFFLNIGLSASLSFTGIALAILFILLLPIKGLLYFLTINYFNFRVRTSLLASLSLFNYSEFGLIVGGLAYKMGWMPSDMLAAIAVAVSLSFIISAPLNRLSNKIYQHSGKWLQETATEKLNQRDQLINPGRAQVLILGMGRIGTGAYDELCTRYGKISLGVEIREDAAVKHRAEGRNVISGDATDPDFWERILDTGHVQLVLLAMPHHQGNQTALEQLQRRNYKGQIAAIAEYPDQLDGLLEQGVDAAFNIYNEAGSGFARHVCQQLEPKFTPIK
ncbi:cation:proton antiporter family protein [Vibrio sp. B1FLJ16]|uniref:cation:proton antiporter family protein n=1 Tax=Vibrio sp. B1FLJ16 TaxID=2751178 RepID=UPI0015F5D53B|nr:cation:proton antiporter family protein [Vibrio sp. B1FLJ16]CAD7801510.1 Belongs to the monovalent cation proton antiporter 2 (CPA2) transporter (TC 2.A.37) family [Vibrio sp. B1FLJ16]CAD7801554.1 Belongs to the monovalent cation proton antiporter 2 (CPA2) transporter (TC 2.A.37) family [Vibrio sp. B1FLJ16]CAE6890296.1 Belongs to the monovalent cation proton antiporter 2 (CPA2) transporter (TC 2.A.37) family [Vibrio sp. B1FLJ16]CAE6891330.1 Belongs to the monovalent cation proton antiporter 